ncbi:CehA/McbA family metallohydrolase [Microbacterium tenebrionis]|uniref:CehA/McbA family metallohydrolase n=1 Tax=Microbacterium tenebrionis TaxID=2830665 RepID=UPI00158B52E8|nr:CehA/McbA family metallohydrolase [Microbacterium ihumii]
MSPSEYVPIDLSGVADVPVDIFEDPQDVRLGARTLYGLPFRFGDAERAVLRVQPGGSARIPIEAPARWLVIAHAVLEPDLFQGGAVGDEIGCYRLEYADNEEVSHTIHQRYEIGPTPRRWNGRPLPLDWGQTPFLARNDAEHELMDRMCGRYDEAGARLVEVEDPQSRVPYVLPYRFYLWALPNPHPDREVRAVRVDASGGSILIGAITRSTLEEEPFTRSVARDVVLDLGARPMTEQVRVEVDRGSSTYVYRTAPEAGTDDEGVALPAGWGHPLDESWPTGYAKISASPSATVAVFDGETELGRFRWGDLLEHGRLDVADGLSVRLPAGEQNWVRTTVRDRDGQLLPCRIRFQSDAGIPIAPYGHHAHINSDGGTWNLDIGGDVRLGAYTYGFIDGACEGWLPVGPVTVEVSRGFEHRPLRERVVIEPGQTELNLVLERVFDARERGYLSGDTHVHFVSTQGAELEARAEDVQVTNLLLSQWGQLFTSTEEFVGRPQYSLDRDAVVFAGQENRTNMLGHINLLGLRKPIMPWCTGGSEEAEIGGGLATTLSHWADECHEQGGTVVLAHFPVPYGETAALLATGRLDAVETIAYDEYNIGEYYRYLNAGYRIPLAAGTDKMTSEVPIGLMRTYAGTPGRDVDYWAWCEGIKRGDTMVSSGPMLWLSVDGERPGSTLLGRRRVGVAVELESLFPVETIEIIRSGVVIERRRVPEGARSHRFEVEVEITGSDWIAARCVGAGAGFLRHTDTWSRPVFAHTSPVYASVDDEYVRFDDDVTRMMLDIVGGARRHVTDHARIEWPGAVQHRHGERDHLAFLTRPFDEATAALRARLADAR